MANAVTEGLTKKEKSSTQRKWENQRRALNDAYASILAERSVQSFSNYTFEDALDDQIERIEGAGTRLSPNLLDRVSRVYEEVKKTVEDLKSLPVSAFASEEEIKDSDNVNT